MGALPINVRLNARGYRGSTAVPNSKCKASAETAPPSDLPQHTKNNNIRLQQFVPLLSIRSSNMFCEKCQSFWDNITSQMQFETSSVQWPENSATIHDDFGSLMRSSSNGCPPCRAIFHAVTREGCPDIPANTTVLFELDPQDGMHPVLSSQLQTSQGHVIIKKFIVAEFSELLEDSELHASASIVAPRL